MHKPKNPLVALLLCASLAFSGSSAVAGTVTGSVVLESSDGGAAKKRDSSGVVVWLEPIGGSARPAPSPPKQAAMEQRNKTFIPHVLAVEVGTAVDFPNHDPIDHNAFSNHDGQVFDVHLYAPQTSRRIVFRRPGMARVFCNIHETMSAVIAVLPTPYFAVTGGAGRFEIRAPAGDYKLQFWHERGQPEVLAKQERRVTLGEGNQALPEIRIAADGSPVTAHKNKYGRDYAARQDEYIFYPGTRR